MTPCEGLPNSLLSFLISVFINATAVNDRQNAYVVKVEAIMRRADEWHGSLDLVQLKR